MRVSSCQQSCMVMHSVCTRPHHRGISILVLLIIYIDQGHVDQISNVQLALETRSANGEQMEKINNEHSTSEIIRQRDHRKDTNTDFDHELGKDIIPKYRFVMSHDESIPRWIMTVCSYNVLESAVQQW